MKTGFGWRAEATDPDAIGRHVVLKAIMKAAQKNMARHKQKGIKFKQIAEEIGVSQKKISDVYRGRYISKRTLSLLIGFGYVKIDDVLPDIPADHIKILTKVIPLWA